MTTRLPVPGGDDNVWGSVLNDFLSQAHNSDGTLKQLSQSQVQNLTSDLAAKTNATDLAPIATSGSYTDLTNKPTIPDASTLVSNTGLDTKAAALIDNTGSSTTAALDTALGRRNVFVVETYGAKADGKQLTDGVTTSGSAVLTSAGPDL